jgi:hypothetical protein
LRLVKKFGIGFIGINPPKGGISIFIAEGYQLLEIDLQS